jgi:hypothetical protein
LKDRGQRLQAADVEAAGGEITDGVGVDDRVDRAAGVGGRGGGLIVLLRKIAVEAEVEPPVEEGEPDAGVDAFCDGGRESIARESGSYAG